MSKEELEPGDIVRHENENLGLVVRNDDEYSVLVAYPGMDELMLERAQQLRYITDLEEATANKLLIEIERKSALGEIE